MPHHKIDRAADDIYSTGIYDGEDQLLIRLIAIGREQNEDLRLTYPRVPQVIWPDVLGFIFDRHQKYRRQKTQTDHWDITGLQLKRMATVRHMTREIFVQRAHDAMGIRGERA